MTGYTTQQEDFWAGEFGSAYIARNLDDKKAIANRVPLWGTIMQTVAQPLGSILEMGANIGINLDAMAILQPEATLSAVEINADAVAILRSKKNIEVFHESILEFTQQRQWDMVFTSGVLIHLSPEALPEVYRRIARCSGKYVCLAEYYHPSPVEVPYRGHAGKLFKRDFAGEFMKSHPEFRLKKYGFVYHGDPCFPADDLTWFLMERYQ